MTIQATDRKIYFAKHHTDGYAIFLNYSYYLIMISCSVSVLALILISAIEK